MRVIIHEDYDPAKMGRDDDDGYGEFVDDDEDVDIGAFAFMDEVEVGPQEGGGVGARVRQAEEEDLSPRARLDVQAGRCAGCGVALQAAEPSAPGYLPAAKLQLAGQIGHKVICSRCHGLRHQNSAEQELRVGHSDRVELSPRRFEDLLAACLRGHDARSRVSAPSSAGCGAVVYLVDLFDVEGSLLPALPRLLQPNCPLILVATKADVLPAGTSLTRVEKWLRALCASRLAGLRPAEVHIISAKTGKGIARLHQSAMAWAGRRRQFGDVYVVGAANVGKSSFLNALLDLRSPARRGKGRRSVGPKGADYALALEEDEEEPPPISGAALQEAAELEPARRANKAAKRARPALLTASHLPGTTLEPVKVRCRDGLVLFDTPGLVLPSQLTRLLTPQEVLLAMPRSALKPTQLSLPEGKTILLGGLARVDVESTGLAKHAVLAVHVAAGVKVHPTRTERAEEVRAMHAGVMLQPPLGGPERLDTLGPLEETEVIVEGQGFRRAAADVAIAGLGWVAVLGDGDVRLRVHAPRGVRVAERDPMLPFIDGVKGNAKFTGTRVLSQGKKKKRRR